MADGLVSPMERERTVVTGLLVLQLLLWLGFLVHRSPRFAGSLTGSLLGIAGAVVMVLPSLAYTAAKRIPRVKRLLNGSLPLRDLLAWHVYGGIVGSLLAILHTGHRFESMLGIALTTTMLLTVFSGYVGRHFLVQVSLDLREKQALLSKLMAAYNALASTPPRTPTGEASRSIWLRLTRGVDVAPTLASEESLDRSSGMAGLASSIAELEYEIRMHDYLKRRFSAWLMVHIAASVLFYALLGLHIWAGVYFGLRWLP